MNTKEMTGEQISAFADGECPNLQVELALAALRQPEGKDAWEIYHQIGDVLRSDDMAVSLSPGFAARMTARLDAEPTIIAPMPAGTEARDVWHAAKDVAPATQSARRWALPGVIAAAAAAAAAFVATPQLMVAMKSEPVAPTSEVVATASLPGPVTRSAAEAERGAVVTASAPGGVVLRDPRIDDYLLAHQRFSPSVFSSAQYARSATFETDSNK